jgi:hypothetical protein
MNSHLPGKLLVCNVPPSLGTRHKDWQRQLCTLLGNLQPATKPIFHISSCHIRLPNECLLASHSFITKASDPRPSYRKALVREEGAGEFWWRGDAGAAAWGDGDW